MPNINRILNLPDIPAPQQVNMTGQGLYPINMSGYENVMAPVSDFVNQIISPIDPNTGLPNVDVAGPVMVGKTGARNAAQILNQIRETGASRPADVAVEFFKRKYPKIAGILEGINVIEHKPEFGGMIGGYFAPENKMVIVDKPDRGIGDIANTLAHEGVHATQFQIPKKLEKYKRLQKEFVDAFRHLNDINPAANPGRAWENPDIPVEYIMPDYNIGPPDVIDWFNSLGPVERKEMQQIRQEIYEAQPVEETAIKGGSTGEKAYENFINQVIPDIKKLDWNDKISPDNVEMLKDIISTKFFSKIRDIEDPVRRGELVGLLDRNLQAIDRIAANGKLFNERIADFLPKDLTLGEIREVAKKHGFTSMPWIKKGEDIRINIGDLVDKLYSGKPSGIYEKSNIPRTKIRGKK